MARYSEKELDEKVKRGEQLYESILSSVHNGNLDEMYSYFESNIERIAFYGETKEERLKNYCAFKEDNVRYLYTSK